jgi:prepilin-type N-terminal cleavage/methylation domain-containing protein
MSGMRMQVRGGFSLIEVLIGIVVLALGLVGLAAVFPTVVRQQQAAADQAQGVSVARSAIATLRMHAELSRPLSDAQLVDRFGVPLSTESLDETINPLNLVGWSVLTWDPAWSLDGSWQVPIVEVSAPSTGGQVSMDPTTGDCYIGRANGPFATRLAPGNPIDPRLIRRGGVVIRTTDRLMPKAETPRFVWDFVVRRQDLGRTQATPLANNLDSFRDDGVQVAVFVRRIDPGIRVGGGSLYGVLANGTRVPVAASAADVPTLDGVGGNGTNLRYSMIQPLRFVFGTPGKFDEIDLTGPVPALLPYAAQIGQRFVDQLGVVHKVVEVLDSGNPATRRVRLETAIRADYATAAPQPNSFMEMIFVPQIPASVEVFNASPSGGDAS